MCSSSSSVRGSDDSVRGSDDSVRKCIHRSVRGSVHRLHVLVGLQVQDLRQKVMLLAQILRDILIGFLFCNIYYSVT